MKNDKKLIAVSGGFDPIHVGHVRMIQAAAEIGDVVVIVNTDGWLEQKKGYKFMPFEERAEILSSIKGVVKVVSAKDDDGTVCSTLAELKEIMNLDCFANGGDRKTGNTPEEMLCSEIGVEMLWNVGGEKIQSSSWLVNDAKNKK